MAIVADLSGHRPKDKKLASPNRATAGSPYGILYPQYSGELVLDAVSGQLFVGGDPSIRTSWTPVMHSMYGPHQGRATPLLGSGVFGTRSPYSLSTTSSWMNDSNVLEEAAVNEPRPQLGGILWEPTALNHITNPRAEGTGSAPPTSWSVSALDASVTATWDGQVVLADGITYQKIRMQSASLATTLAGRIHLGGTTAIPATAANGIAAGVHYALTAGTTNNAVFRFRMPNAIVPTYTMIPAILPIGLTMRERFTFAGDVAQGLQIQVDGTVGQPVDFTLALGLPSAVPGDMFTSVPLPPVAAPAAFTRGPTKSITTLGTLYNSNAGTIVLEAYLSQQSVAIQGLFALDDTTFNQRLYFYVLPSSTDVIATAFNGGVQSLYGNVGTVPLTTFFRIAVSFTPTGIKCSINGSVPVSVAGTVPVSTFSRIYLGDVGIGALTMNGIIKSAVYYETAMGDDLLQQATAS